MTFAFRAALLLTLLAEPLVARGGDGSASDNNPVLTYRVVTAAEESAQPVAWQILRLLAAGDIDAAAELSNEPARRREVLNEYQARVGEAEFRRVFDEYLSPRNHVVEELAIGLHRLIIWDLAEAAHRIAGQYYVQTADRFLMDDRPSAERAALQHLLEQHRKKRRE